MLEPPHLLSEAALCLHFSEAACPNHQAKGLSLFFFLVTYVNWISVSHFSPCATNTFLE